jgi:hypothetical protein
MQAPLQAPPLARRWGSWVEANEPSRKEASSARPAADSGVVPAGPERCYNLRGPAQEICFESFY